MRRLPTLLSFVALGATLAACGSDKETFTPFEGSSSGGGDGSPTRVSEVASASADGPRLVVRSPYRYLSVTWRAGNAAGKGRLIAQGKPTPGGSRRTTFVLAGLPKGAEGTATLRGSLPLSAVKEVPVSSRTRTVDLGRLDGKCSLRRPGGCAQSQPLPGDADGSVHVSPQGNDGASGSAQDPLATVDAALGREGVRRVLLAPGRYPAIRDSRVRPTPVSIEGAGIGQTVVAGAVLPGAKGIHLSRATFSAPVQVGGRRRPAEDVVIAESELTAPTTTCMGVQAGSKRVELRDSWVHDCKYGLTGGFSGDDDGPVTSRVKVTGNLMDSFVGDAIQFTDWEDVEIRRNVIRDMHAGEADDHNDGIQIVGGSSRVAIIQNEISSSDNQLILIANDLGGPSSRIRVENNLLYGAGSWALNSFGADRVTIVNNTIWDNRAGALILGKPRTGDRKPATDTVVANNVLDSMFLQDGARTKVQTGNVLGRASGLGRGDAQVATPGFVAPQEGNFRLTSRAAARRPASERYLPFADLLGVPRRGTPTAGALG